MEIRHRPAQVGDAEALFSWRNDPASRKFSLDSEVISPDGHANWFHSRIQRQSSEPFTFFEGTYGRIGMTRLDSISGDYDGFVLSIIVNPEFQGLGIGRKILTITCDLVAKEFPGKFISAKVHKDNHISQNLFKSSGFINLMSDGDFFIYVKHPG